MERAAQASLGVGVPPPPATDSPQDALAQAPHFKDLPMSVINGLRARLVDFVPTPTATEDQQSILCQQGQDSSHVYYLVRGYVQVSRRDEASREERLVAHLAPGMWVGEIGLLTGQGVHTTTAKAATEVRVVEISSVDYLTALQSATAVETAARQEAAARFAVWRGAQTSAQRAQEFVAQQRLLAARHLRVVDLEKCIRCGNCMTACAAAHDDGIARFGWTPQPPSKVDEPLQWLPTLRMETAPPLLFPGSCRHCEDAPCLFPCPTSAITRGRNHEGEVHVIAERCIGCSGCEASCPFGAIQMRPRPRPADKAPTPAGVFAWLTRRTTRCRSSATCVGAENFKPASNIVPSERSSASRTRNPLMRFF
jgi:Fe-S-cluster-containing dehydrogenase component